MTYNDECDPGPLCGRVVCVLSAPLGVDDGFEGEANGHADTSKYKWFFPSDAIQDEGNEKPSNNNTKSAIDTSDQQNVGSAHSQGGIY